MVAKKLTSLDTGTVEGIQMQLLALVGSPAVSQGYIFQVRVENQKIAY